MINCRIRQIGQVIGSVFIAVMLVLSACVPVEEVEYHLRKDMGDSVVVRILGYQNAHSTDSLLTYFKHPDPTYRYYSVRAFQSYTDSAAIRNISALLSDENIEVATAAAYALGQSGIKSTVTALIEHYDNNDSLGEKNILNSTILEAVGKTGGADELYLFTSIQTFLPIDTVLYTGLMRGVLQFQLRNIYSDDVDVLVKEILLNANYPYQVRLLACEIAQRSKTISLSKEFYALKRLVGQAENINLKTAYVRLFHKLSGKEVREYLRTIIEDSTGVAVRATALQALSSHPYSAIHDILEDIIQRDEPQLTDIALGILLQKGPEERVFEYQTLLEKIDRPFAKAKLYQVVMRKLPFYYAVTKRALRNKIQNMIREAESPYLIAQLYAALAEDAFNYDLLIEEGLSHKEAIVRTASIKGLLRILESPGLDQQFRTQSSKVRKAIYAAFNQALEERADDGAICELLDAENGSVFEHIKESILVAQEKLKLPESWEAYLAICEKMGCDMPPKDGFIKDIEISQLLSLKDSIDAVISTDFGEITLKLYPHAAPYTVISVMELIEQGYYDEKYIHRVAPQFVIQDGCPRGDGYGGLDFMLRSETPQRYYDEGGIVGMASAGRDTESSQWFITYRNTPHLNGRYTIFGRVISGLENIQFATVGAQIHSIKIIKN